MQQSVRDKTDERSHETTCDDPDPINPGHNHLLRKPLTTDPLAAGATPKTVAPRLGVVNGANGNELYADFSFLTGSSVLFDAVYVPGGDASLEALMQQAEASEFVNEAFKHCKAIAANGAGIELLASALRGAIQRAGVLRKTARDK